MAFFSQAVFICAIVEINVGWSRSCHIQSDKIMELMDEEKVFELGMVYWD